MTNPRCAARVTGWIVMGLIGALLTLNLVEVIRGWEQLTPVGAGRQAPAFSLKVVGEEGQVSLAEQRGKVVLLSFWATWCRPCIEELPVLAALQKEDTEGRLRILAINIDEEPHEIAAFLKEHRIDASLTILEGTSALATRYGVSTLPHLVMVGPTGQVLDVHTGALSEQRLRQWVKQALEQKPR